MGGLLKPQGLLAMLGLGRRRRRRFVWRFPGPTYWLTLLVCLLTLLPVAQLAASLPYPAADGWEQLRPQLLTLLSNSVVLLAKVVLGCGFLGTGLAWLTTLCEFPGRRFFGWALALPMAIPAYVMGLVVVGLFDSNGLGHDAWLAWKGESASIPPVRSADGLVLTLTLSLYPYVYLPARYAFQTRCGQAMEAARGLGLGPYAAFFRVALPVAGPWIGVGLAWVAMETLADLGTVSLFGYDTFTTAIYRTWSGRPALPMVVQLSSILMLLALAVLALEFYQRKQQQHSHLDTKPARATRLSTPLSLCAVACSVLILCVVFVIPLEQLLLWSAESMATEWNSQFFGYLLNTLSLAGAGAGAVVAIAVAINLAKRHHPGLGFGAIARTATLGYCLPGVALAIGITLPIAAFDDSLVSFAQSRLHFGVSTILSGGLGLLLLAYLIRFLADGFSTTREAFERITPDMERAAHTLGMHGFALGWQLHFPLLRGGLLVAFLLPLVEIIREMPIILLIRPVGWDTLAVRIFEVAAEGDWRRAALPAVLVVFAGLVPAILLLIRGTGERYA